MSIPGDITRKHIEDAARRLDAGEDAEGFWKSKKYEIRVGSRTYAPKKLVALAAKHGLGIELTPKDFGGGESRSATNPFFRSLGFEVVDKSGSVVEGLTLRAARERTDRGPLRAQVFERLCAGKTGLPARFVEAPDAPPTRAELHDGNVVLRITKDQVNQAGELARQQGAGSWFELFPSESVGEDVWVAATRAGLFYKWLYTDQQYDTRPRFNGWEKWVLELPNGDLASLHLRDESDAVEVWADQGGDAPAALLADALRIAPAEESRTLADVAFEVLTQATGPLTPADIAERGSHLFTTRADDPATVIGMAIRREISGDAPRFRRHARGVYGLLQQDWRSRLEQWRTSPAFGAWERAKDSEQEVEQELGAVGRAFMDSGNVDEFLHGLTRLSELDDARFAEHAGFLLSLVRALGDHAKDVLGEVLKAPSNAEDASAQLRHARTFLASGEMPMFEAASRLRGAAAAVWSAMGAPVPTWSSEAATQLARMGGQSLEELTWDVAYGVYTRDLQTIVEETDAGFAESVAFLRWLSQPRLSQPGPRTPETRRVWLMSPGRGAEHWDHFRTHGYAGLGWNDVGDLRAYASAEAIGDKIQEIQGGDTRPTNDRKAMWQFLHEMAPGDIIVAKQGVRRLIGAGVVTSAYEFVPRGQVYAHQRKVDWADIEAVETSGLPMKMLTASSTDLLDTLGWRPDGPDVGGPIIEPPETTYNMEDALKDLFLDRQSLSQMLKLLKRKRNLVLQGPPGTGKTYVAQALAQLMVEGTADEQIRRVQFHQAMTYEQFVRGFRPGSGDAAFELADGPFLDFCQRARRDENSNYVLLIDEINRGNLSRIFGELMLLIEGDKREPKWAVQLAYPRREDERFWVPPNLFIIGTMNTADRSLALVDYALRRRFAFIDVPSAIATSRFHDFLRQKGVPSAAVARIGSQFGALNKMIGDDATLGRGFCIGHSYFCAVPDGSGDEDDPFALWVEDVIKTEIVPLLEEYWFDSPGRLAEARRHLGGASA